ncbi:MAG: hypothetical protein MJ151_01150, partial [Lachnospiraceae bacterium]|nr:hypothetical protein [Lachnospiraceae bacterium]
VVICITSTFSYAKGWIEVDGEWCFFDNEDQMLTETIKASDGYKYYLDENGHMVRDYLLEGYNEAIYYFDDEGRMVSNTWVAVDPQQVSNPIEDGPTIYLYYFGANGKAYKATNGVKRKTIDGKKYLFDEEGRMLSGWINEQGEMFTSQDADEDPFQDEYIYYAGDETDGVLKEGWYEYTEGSLNEDYYDKESMWIYLMFFFSSFGACGFILIHQAIKK